MDMRWTLLREGSLLTDQLVSDALDSWKGLSFFFLSPLLVLLLHNKLPGEKEQRVGPLYSTGLRGLSTDAGAQGPTTTARDAKPVSRR